MPFFYYFFVPSLRASIKGKVHVSNVTMLTGDAGGSFIILMSFFSFNLGVSLKAVGRVVSSY